MSVVLASQPGNKSICFIDQNLFEKKKTGKGKEQITELLIRIAVKNICFQRSMRF